LPLPNLRGSVMDERGAAKLIGVVESHEFVAKG
jgi:hypothetical protein